MKIVLWLAIVAVVVGSLSVVLRAASAEGQPTWSITLLEGYKNK